MVALVLFHDLLDLPLIVASPLAVETSIFNNFWWNSRWTFGQRRASWPRALVKYNLTCLAGLVICTATLQALVALLGIHYLLANLAGIGLAASSNFLLSNGWAWRDTRTVELPSRKAA
jgi:dolichol-phosphate mannosyltransferase